MYYIPLSVLGLLRSDCRLSPRPRGGARGRGIEIHVIEYFQGRTDSPWFAATLESHANNSMRCTCITHVNKVASPIIPAAAPAVPGTGVLGPLLLIDANIGTRLPQQTCRPRRSGDGSASASGQSFKCATRRAVERRAQRSRRYRPHSWYFPPST